MMDTKKIFQYRNQNQKFLKENKMKDNFKKQFNQIKTQNLNIKTQKRKGLEWKMNQNKKILNNQNKYLSQKQKMITQKPNLQKKRQKSKNQELKISLKRKYVIIDIWKIKDQSKKRCIWKKQQIDYKMNRTIKSQKLNLLKKNSEKCQMILNMLQTITKVQYRKTKNKKNIQDKQNMRRINKKKMRTNKIIKYKFWKWKYQIKMKVQKINKTRFQKQNKSILIYNKNVKIQKNKEININKKLQIIIINQEKKLVKILTQIINLWLQTNNLEIKVFLQKILKIKWMNLKRMYKKLSNKTIIQQMKLKFLKEIMINQSFRMKKFYFIFNFKFIFFQLVRQLVLFNEQDEEIVKMLDRKQQVKELKNKVENFILQTQGDITKQQQQYSYIQTNIKQKNLQDL
ncbi:hypothetical protein IMG5_146250 [Ichthyophthirius multifiliis]|uniref:Uncharacterized protein n=1 Tax=Ichthyophthirius multifiliis TaxID=5932 RepID=G0QXZ3_ICHMU|nr:hypothetical protein IMG5_146250 [Ichthyophthirius multifiliis]EGR29907.1 hypothetical protein IMG5_146250 [Ichthyophthirius multifiliis]|eukprot:XP_004031143.1 hypothetical protein IMG5_146250 [Ichthyophthirius multifiliis]